MHLTARRWYGRGAVGGPARVGGDLHTIPPEVFARDRDRIGQIVGQAAGRGGRGGSQVRGGHQVELQHRRGGIRAVIVGIAAAPREAVPFEVPP